MTQQPRLKFAWAGGLCSTGGGSAAHQSILNEPMDSVEAKELIKHSQRRHDLPLSQTHADAGLNDAFSIELKPVKRGGETVKHTISGLVCQKRIYMADQLHNRENEEAFNQGLIELNYYIDDKGVVHFR